MQLDVVLISAKQGGGKSTLAADIRKTIKDQQLDWAVEEFIFAGAIYEMHDACRAVLSKYGIEPKGIKDGTLLQLLGTEWGRKFYGDDVWVDILRNKIREARQNCAAKRLTIVVPDLRFKNEVHVWPYNRETITIRLECPEELRRERCSNWRENTSHPSETDLDDCVGKFHYVFDTSSLSSLTIARKIVGELYYSR